MISGDVGRRREIEPLRILTGGSPRLLAIVAELARVFPRAREAQVRGFYVTREHQATFRQAPGSLARRPGPRTALPNVLLAGAWTDTGWPATMEGAVRSGNRAGEHAIKALGLTTSVAA